MESASACVATCLKAWGVRTSKGIKQVYRVSTGSQWREIPCNPCPDFWLARVSNVLQLQDLLSPRKVTGHAGPAGLTVKSRSAAGHATVTQRGSSEQCAGGKSEVKNTAEQSTMISFWIPKCLSDTWKLKQRKSAGKAEKNRATLWSAGVIQVRKASSLNSKLSF